MNDSFTMRVSAATDVLVQELAGEAVLLNLKTEQYFGLDAVGARMWQSLVSEPSIQRGFRAVAWPVRRTARSSCALGI